MLKLKLPYIDTYSETFICRSSHTVKILKYIIIRILDRSDWIFLGNGFQYLFIILFLTSYPRVSEIFHILH